MESRGRGYMQSVANVRGRWHRIYRANERLPTVGTRCSDSLGLQQAGPARGFASIVWKHSQYECLLWKHLVKFHTFHMLQKLPQSTTASFKQAGPISNATWCTCNSVWCGWLLHQPSDLVTNQLVVSGQAVALVAHSRAPQLPQVVGVHKLHADDNDTHGKHTAQQRVQMKT